MFGLSTSIYWLPALVFHIGVDGRVEQYYPLGYIIIAVALVRYREQAGLPTADSEFFW